MSTDAAGKTSSTADAERVHDLGNEHKRDVLRNATRNSVNSRRRMPPFKVIIDVVESSEDLSAADDVITG